MRRTLVALFALALLAAACGDDGADGGGSSPSADGPVTIDAVPVADRSRPSPDDDPAVAGAPTLELGLRLLDEVPAEGNPILSPTSIAIALAMVEPGATGDAQTQLRELLCIDDPEQYHAAMNALEQSLEGRAAADFEEGDLTARISNGAYLQQGYPFEEDYLDTIGRYYGPVLNEVDFQADPDAVAHQINDDVAEATNDRIADLIPDGQLSTDTVFAWSTPSTSTPRGSSPSRPTPPRTARSPPRTARSPCR